MSPRLAASLLAAALLFAAITNYVPAFVDDEGRVFGLFRLDIYKDALHLASALWALAAVAMGRAASVTFLRVFGTLYFIDGICGVLTGASFLDLSLFIHGIARDMPWMVSFLSSIPHLALGGFGMATGWLGARRG
ncbi:DUF4383 domain-containing protein [Falsiroseomonas ponticola]|uniref:DUF4383 domain-containing protein n=1 Tax=Falsiroseomonas ponticola TaxID=2786951 RepID=UPI001932EFDC|nr:DUF4383 domain-containing protein [Roseomonas ponticola]